MSAAAVLDAIRAAGGEVYVEGDGLRVVPKAVLTRDLRASVLEHKGAILDALADEASERWLILRGDERVLMATVPARRLSDMLARHPGACIRPLSVAAWAAYGEENGDADDAR
jgi:hypothetical protein